MIAWIVLVISGVFEAVWVTALGRSDGLTKITPTIVFFFALVASMFGLAYALRSLPTGTTYAVWVGIGSVLTIAFAIFTGVEQATFAKLVLISMIIIGIVGLKVIHT